MGINGSNIEMEEVGKCPNENCQDSCHAWQRALDAAIAEEFCHEVTGVQKAHAERIAAAIREQEGVEGVRVDGRRRNLTDSDVI